MIQHKIQEGRRHRRWVGAALGAVCVVATVTAIAPGASAVTVRPVIDTVAGNGSWMFSGDGGPATSAGIEFVHDATTLNGDLFVSTSTRLRRIDSAGRISTAAGLDTYASSGDGGPAAAAALCPSDLATSGTALFTLDSCGDSVRKIEAGVITTVAGGGTITSPNFVPATSAKLDPRAIAHATGRLYVADALTSTIYVVEPTGLIHPVVTNACVEALAVDRAGNVYFTECSEYIVRVTPAGTRSNIAGTGDSGYSGDGGPAHLAQISLSLDIAVDALGTLYIADTFNYRVRAISPAGIITTVAGNGEAGFSGDGGPATAAQIGNAYGIDVDPTGSLLLADSTNYRVRRIVIAAPTSPTPLPVPTDVVPPLPELETVPATGFASDGCATGSVIAARTYGDVSVRIFTVQADSDTRWVCVRADGPSVATGGRFEINGAGVSTPGVPTTDDDTAACATAPGNAVPGPHPALAAAVGDPGDPATYLPVVLDSYAGNQAAWVCVQVGAARHRVVVPAGVGVSPPSVTFVPDVAGSHLPPLGAQPAKPSGTCHSSTLLFDGTAGPGRVVVFGGPMPLCVRLEGPVTVGGRFDFTDNTGNLVPIVETSRTDMTPCTVQVGGVTSPANAQVRRSPTGVVPTSICVTVGLESLRVTVGPGSGGEPVGVTWTPDPGTPGLP